MQATPTTARTVDARPELEDMGMDAPLYQVGDQARSIYRFIDLSIYLRRARVKCFRRRPIRFF